MRIPIGLTLLFVLPSLLSAQQIDYMLYSHKWKSPLTAVKVSPDNSKLLVGREDGTLMVLGLPDYNLLMEIEEASPSPIYDIEMSPKMDVIFIASGSRIMLYDTTGTHIINWPHHKNTMWSMDISPSGDFMVSTEVNKTFQLSNIYEGRIEAAMRAHDDITLAVAFSPDGKMIASGSNDKRVFLWDLETREVIATFHGLSDNIYDVAFSPDGRYLAACSRDKSVRIWNIKEKTLLHLLKGHSDIVLEIEFSPDNRYLLSASADMAIKLWDVNSGKQLYAYLENEAGLSDIEFLPGGSAFVSSGADGYLKAWEIHPEIFVLNYFEEEFEEELLENPIFKPRAKGEKKSDFEERCGKAGMLKAEIIEKYYQKYLEKYTSGSLDTE